MSEYDPMLKFRTWMMMTDEEHDLLVGMLTTIYEGPPFLPGFTQHERWVARRVAALLHSDWKLCPSCGELMRNIPGDCCCCRGEHG